MSNRLVLCALLATLAAAAENKPAWLLSNFSDRLEVHLANPGASPVETVVVIPVRDAVAVAPRFPGTMAVAVVPGSTVEVLPSQADDLDADGTPDEFVFPVRMAAHSETTVHVYYSATLRETLPWPKRVHASHSFGYNRATVSLESETIGYRTYGGFFLDVQARHAGNPGLNNALVGFFGTSAPGVGRDVIHLGDTLGLGGLFLRAGGELFRPPLNVPDYAHMPPAPESPSYRVISEGPVRAVVKAWMDRWTIGKDAVRIEALYSIAAGTDSVECRFTVTPLSLSRSYEVGTGVRQLPKMREDPAVGRLAVEGEQEAAIGRIGLGLFYDPQTAGDPQLLATPEGQNNAVVFRARLEPGRAVSGRYFVAADWSGSGISDLLGHLADAGRAAQSRIAVRGYTHTATPEPKQLEGEAQ